MKGDCEHAVSPSTSCCRPLLVPLNPPPRPTSTMLMSLALFSPSSSSSCGFPMMLSERAHGEPKSSEVYVTRAHVAVI